MLPVDKLPAFFVHHLATISAGAAVRLADALTLENKAAALSFVHVTNGARRAGVHAA